jgi:hypothetical protein
MRALDVLLEGRAAYLPQDNRYAPYLFAIRSQIRLFSRPTVSDSVDTE